MGETPQRGGGVLVVPEYRRGHGTGHLRRCLALSRKLMADHRLPVTWLLGEEGDSRRYSRSDVCALLQDPLDDLLFLDDGVSGEGAGSASRGLPGDDAPRFSRIIVDRRWCTREELESLPPGDLLVALDAPRDLRRYAECLIDLLPTPPGAAPPNIQDPGLLPLPEAVREEWPVAPRSILVVFGGEEHDEQTWRVARGVAHAMARGVAHGVTTAGAADPSPGVRVTAVVHSTAGDLPPGGGGAPLPVTAMAPTAHLREMLHTFDLVITHYGLLVWEALWARVPVITVNPGGYHRRLADHAGIPVAPTTGALHRLVGQFPRIVSQCRGCRPQRRGDLAAEIAALRAPAVSGSPAGGGRWHRAIMRFPDRTFFRDTRTAILYLVVFRGAEITYGHDYFFSEYRKQYGRTYLEDFPAIRATGERRIADILRVIPGNRRKAPVLLDIGCAYGPFLTAARDASCRVQGIDLNGEAVRYVRETLGIPAEQVDLSTLHQQQFPEPLDIITMWYVIEHISPLTNLLCTVHDLLPPGGIFAFSTPHGGGISARRNRALFLDRSPRDHVTIWDRRSARRVLRHHGFRVRRVRVTGHHPERFPGGGVALLHPVIHRISRWFRLGDTFEVIAERLP